MVVTGKEEWKRMRNNDNTVDDWRDAWGRKWFRSASLVTYEADDGLSRVTDKADDE
jgi:hypothetical protein